MAIRTVFLDFGGTLVSAETDPGVFFTEVLREQGHDISVEAWTAADAKAFARWQPERYRCFREPPSFWLRVHGETLRELGLPDPDGALLGAIHDAMTSARRRRPFPEAERAVDAIRRSGRSVHIVSNATDLLLELVAHLG